MKNDLNGMTLPTCEICVNGQKRKLYGKKKNKVYLHNGDNFQLKLFNPLQERIGVQLNMNGSNIDNDLLVLNPGQEFTIERFIGTNRKMTFSSYDIDTTNMSEAKIEKAKKAIEKNGLLEVIFWNEKKPQSGFFSTTTDPFIYNTTSTGTLHLNIPSIGSITTPSIGSTTTPIGCTTILSGATSSINIDSNGNITLNGNVKINGSIDVNNGDFTVKNVGTSGSSGTGGTTGIPGTSGIPINTNLNVGYVNYNTTSGEYNYSCGGFQTDNLNSRLYSSIDFAPQEMRRGIVSSQLSKKIETGRIEKGNKSNQYFSPISFEIGEPFYKIKFKLLPFSLKPVKKKLYDSTTIKNVLMGNISNTYIKNESTIREYCACGYRVTRGKGTWKYCPMCSKKI